MTRVSAWASSWTPFHWSRADGLGETLFAGWYSERPDERIAMAGARLARGLAATVGVDLPVAALRRHRTMVAPRSAVLEVKLPDGLIVRGENAAAVAELVRALQAPN